MSVEALHHVQLAMPPGGEPQARAFYQDLLGIPEVPRPPALPPRGGCWFERGAVRAHPGVEPDFHAACKAHPALLVRDLPALVGRLRAAGHACREDCGMPGMRRRYVDDPCGNRIELLAAEPGAPRAA